MRKLFLAVFLFAISILNANCANKDNFHKDLDEYIEVAKTLSNKKMTQDDETKLTNMANGIISNFKKEYITEKLKSTDIVLRYKNNKKFPDISKHNLKNKYNAQIIKFTIGIYGIYKLFFNDSSNNYIAEIVKKSPLELVPLLREIRTFFEFATSNPKDYGNGVFAVKIKNKTALYADDETLLRIMQPILYKNLVKSTDDDIFKLSRITSAFYKDLPEETDKKGFTKDDVFLSVCKDILEKTIKNLKRSTADNKSRAVIYSNTQLSVDSNIVDNASSHPVESNYQSMKNHYLASIENHTRGKHKEGAAEHLKKATEAAKELLGIKDNIKLSVYDKIEPFCKELEDEALKQEKFTKSNDHEIVKKAKRDINNCKEISKFLKCAAKLLESFYEDSSLLPTLIQNDPLSIVSISKETTVMLLALKIILKDPKDQEPVIKKMREFAKTSEDGTYLLSTIMSIAMTNPNLDFKKALKTEESFKNQEYRKYLEIR